MAAAAMTLAIPAPKGGRPMAGPPSYLTEHLARVFGTEEDPVNCAFYFKVGACRHGDICSKKHNRPTASRTLLLLHMYPNPSEAIAIGNYQPWDDAMYNKAQRHLEAFYGELVLTLADYGEVEEVVVVDNMSDYMIGNVYVKFYYEDDAERALRGLTGRTYFGKRIGAEYSPVYDFCEARCRAFHETSCARAGMCRFLHIKHIPKAVKSRVAAQMYEEHPEYRRRSPSHGRRKRSRSGGRGRSRGRRKRSKSRRRRGAAVPSPPRETPPPLALQDGRVPSPPPGSPPPDATGAASSQLALPPASKRRSLAETPQPASPPLPAVLPAKEKRNRQLRDLQRDFEAGAVWEPPNLVE